MKSTYFKVALSPQQKMPEPDPGCYHFIVLAPFQPPAKLFFENVTIGNECIKEVIFDLILPKDFDKHGFSVAIMAGTVEPQDEIRINIKWIPRDVCQWRGTIQVNGQKKYNSIIITASSIGNSKMLMKGKPRHLRENNVRQSIRRETYLVERSQILSSTTRQITQENLGSPIPSASKSSPKNRSFDRDSLEEIPEMEDKENAPSLSKMDNYSFREQSFNFDTSPMSKNREDKSFAFSTPMPLNKAQYFETSSTFLLSETCKNPYRSVESKLSTRSMPKFKASPKKNFKKSPIIKQKLIFEEIVQSKVDTRKPEENFHSVNNPFDRKCYNIVYPLDKHEQELIKWLNSVLTPPKEWAEHDKEIDIAKLWQKSQAQDKIELAPTKEQVCFEYHKDGERFSAITNRGLELFQSSQVTSVFYSIKGMIVKNQLSIKDDLNLYSDQGVRYQLVSLITCYNTLWLRLGLEVMFKVKITHTNNLMGNLISFLKSHFLSDKNIVDRNTYSKNSTFKKPAFKNEINNYVLEKLFQLVYFLDQAKTKRLIPYDPCLFRKRSTIKSSEQMLNEIIKEFIKCVGHMKKSLTSNGYILKYQQSPLDDFDFAFSTSDELRDGIRITKSVEIILKRFDICDKLRVPSISRLQKIHNVKLALDALKLEGFNIEDVTSQDIVNGTRDKIMSLLWQILYKFLTPRLEAAAKKIQSWWRCKIVQLKFKKQIETLRIKKEEQKRQKAAIYIQQVFRANLLMKKERDLFIKKKNAGIKIQRWFRAKTLMKKERVDFLNKKLAAIKIQKFVRNRVLVKKERDIFVEKRAAAIKIQRWFRATQLMKKDRACYLKQKQAAITIQTKFRATLLMREKRSEFLQLKTVAIKIQSKFRATLLMKKEQTHFTKQKSAAIKIQRWFRATILMRKERTHFNEQKSAAIKIQRWFRATQLMKKDRAHYLELKRIQFEKRESAAIKIQRQFRATLLMRKEQAHFTVQKLAAIKIQRWFRATQLMKKDRTNFLKQKNAATKIQRFVRSTYLMRKERAEFFNQKTAAVKIQRWFRATQLMKKERAQFLEKKQAVLKIEIFVHKTMLMRKERKNFIEKKYAAIKIQRWFRATQLMKKDRAHYLELKRMQYQKRESAAIKIQSKFRACILMRKERTHFIEQKSAAIKIQRWFRATQLMKKDRAYYLGLKQAAITIQSKFRATILMKETRLEFLQLKVATITTQRKFRATVLMRKLRNLFIERKSATIKIQRWVRATQLMNKDRAFYLRQKQAAIKIQTKFQATLLMREKRSEFLHLKAAAITIQRKFRATLLMRKERNFFIERKSAAIKIQKWFRATQLMKKDRAHYLELKRSQFQERESAAIKIQSKFRATILMRKERTHFTELKSAAIKIQRWFRATQLMKKDRAHYLELKRIKNQERESAAIKIQSSFRATLLMRKEQTHFTKQKSAAIKIQRWFRATQLMKKEKSQFLEQKEATIKIQKKIRATFLMKKKRSEFLQRKTAAIKIQRWYRSIKAVRKQQSEFRKIVHSATVIQACWRGYQARKTHHFIKSQYIQGPSLGEKYTETMASLRNELMLPSSQLWQIQHWLETIERLTSVSPILSIEFSKDDEFQELFWRLLAASNRSLAYQQIFSCGLSILIQLILFEQTRDSIFVHMVSNDGIRTMEYFLIKFHPSNRELFCKTATFLWIVGKNPNWKSVMTASPDFLKTIDSYYNKEMKNTHPLPKKSPLPYLKLAWGYGKETTYFDNSKTAVIELKKTYF